MAFHPFVRRVLPPGRRPSSRGARTRAALRVVRWWSKMGMKKPHHAPMYALWGHQDPSGAAPRERPPDHSVARSPRRMAAEKAICPTRRPISRWPARSALMVLSAPADVKKKARARFRLFRIRLLPSVGPPSRIDRFSTRDGAGRVGPPARTRPGHLARDLLQGRHASAVTEAECRQAKLTLAAFYGWSVVYYCCHSLIFRNFPILA
jgi:hypothetical protein